MRIFGMELVNTFARFARETSPPQVAPTDHRYVDDVIAAPYRRFYNPDALKFPEAMKPVVPGDGGFAAFGSGMVACDNQPSWDRGAGCDAGPVREFFRGVMFDNRIKHA